MTTEKFVKKINRMLVAGIILSNLFLIAFVIFFSIDDPDVSINKDKKKPIQICHMASRESFSRYVYDLHETVNKMLHKKSNLTYCDIRERYEHFRSRCTEEKPKIFTFKKSTMTKRKKEKGCTEPLYGKKSKCVINIVPQEDKTASFKMDKKCIKTRD